MKAPIKMLFPTVRVHLPGDVHRHPRAGHAQPRKGCSASDGIGASRRKGGFRQRASRQGGGAGLTPIRRVRRARPRPAAVSAASSRRCGVPTSFATNSTRRSRRERELRESLGAGKWRLPLARRSSSHEVGRRLAELEQHALQLAERESALSAHEARRRRASRRVRRPATASWERLRADVDVAAIRVSERRAGDRAEGARAEVRRRRARRGRRGQALRSGSRPSMTGSWPSRRRRQSPSPASRGLESAERKAGATVRRVEREQRAVERAEEALDARRAIGFRGGGGLRKPRMRSSRRAATRFPSGALQLDAESANLSGQALQLESARKAATASLPQFADLERREQEIVAREA